MIHKRTFQYNGNVKPQEDNEFGVLQVVLRARNLMSVMMTIVAGLMLYRFTVSYIEQVHFDFIDYQTFLWQLEHVVQYKMTETLIWLFMSLVALLALLWGIYSLLFKKISFYERGFIIGKRRILYDNIEKISYKRVRGVSRKWIYAYNQFCIQFKNPKENIILNSYEYPKLNMIMRSLGQQFGCFIKK